MQCHVSLGFLFLSKNSRDKDNTAVQCQITEVLPPVCPCNAGFLAGLCWKKSQSPHYSLCVCDRGVVGGGGRVTNDWSIII